MCGIAGIWNQPDVDTVARMTRSVASRGPDGLDWVTRNNSSLGASRLAIVGDPKASPVFVDPSTGVTVLLNGEIYNATSLRGELASNGIGFHSDLESEVVAKLFRIHGPAFAKLLKGMFAIAILDNNRLVLARDRFGIKPMYYADQGDKVVFGSEIKAILEHPGVSRLLDVSALEESMVFGYVFSPDKTLVGGIRQVEPGTVAEFAINERRLHRFCELPKARYQGENEPIPYDEAVAKLRKTIIETMDLLLNHGGDEKGIYLSGGLDSTILTLISRTILDHPITTFTLGDDPNNPDFLAAREVANKLGTRHVERLVTLEDYSRVLRSFVGHYEAMLVGGVFDVHGAPAFHLLSETVSEHVRVAFSGEGADELFGGYYWIYTHPLGFADRIRNRARLCSNGNGTGKLVADLFPLPEDEHIYRRNLFDALVNGGLANCHLQSVDRSAGVFGFEVRPAYLFDDVADLALNLPIEYKVPDKGITKRILRDAFKSDLERVGLEWVLTRRKQGMPAAVSNLAPLMTKQIESTVDDSSFSRHPFRKYLPTKTDVYFFDQFSEVFLRN